MGDKWIILVRVGGR